MTTNSELLERRRQAVPRGVANIHTRFAERAENGEIWDVEGKRYIDFAGGIGVLNTGHRHPKIMQAVNRQMEKFTHTCFHVMPYEPYLELAEKLNALAPGDEPKKTMLVTTGAEAVENAIKFARAHTGRSGVIAFGGGFHGRTHMAMALTGKVVPYKAGFGPFPSEIHHAPYPCALHGVSVEMAISGIEKLFKTDIDPKRVAAIIVEPVQGEGGFYIAPTEFLQKIREICDQHGILMIADEVQSGFGRTGRMFAIEHAGVVPDMITLAKSLAGGFPLAAVVGRADILDAPPIGGVGGTYGGNPLSCVAALAVLDVMEEENLCDRSNEIGQTIRNRLTKAAQRFPQIAEVRGLGSMVAMELFEDPERSVPAAKLTSALVAEAAQRGLILLACGVYANVIRVLVPLTVSDDLIDEAVDIIEQCLEHLIPDTAS
jgi:4-aminobutyrate aminotransferase/(S)-3-amino-2-methylpropionate transaminase